MLGNLGLILLIGPLCERHYGKRRLCVIVLSVAVSSSIAFTVLGKGNSSHLGASGVVFSLILLNSLCNYKEKKIPFTLLCTIVMWLTKELVLLLHDDGISHLGHLTGGVVGTLAGN